MENTNLVKYLVNGGIKIHTCNRCNYVWLSKRRLKTFIPKYCPRCKSPYWNKKRTRNLN